MVISNESTYNTFQNSENIDNCAEKKSLAERINLAIKEAQPLIKVNKEDEKMALLINDFIYGRINLKEFNAKNETKIEISKPGTVEFVDLEEMYNALKEILKSEEIARELTNHEKAHFDKVIEVGWMAKILCRFFMDEAKELSLRPGILPDIPKSGDEKEIRNKLKSIIEAVHDQSDMDEISTKSN